MKFSVFHASRQGPRTYNQDRVAYAYNKEALLMVVADGMGGHRHGEVAAQLAIKILTDAFEAESHPQLNNPHVFLQAHILAIHEAINNTTKTQALDDAPRTTIVAVIVQHGQVFAAHVGDSRLYHFRNQKTLFCTEDHSLVQRLYRQGQITSDARLTHPERNKIYNCLGGDISPKIELSPASRLADGDFLLLCTDGVWAHAHETQIIQTIYSGNISSTLLALLDLAENNAGANGDNMSAIGLQLGETPHTINSEVISTSTMPLGETTTILAANSKKWALQP